MMVLMGDADAVSEELSVSFSDLDSRMKKIVSNSIANAQVKAAGPVLWLLAGGIPGILGAIVCFSGHAFAGSFIRNAARKQLGKIKIGGAPVDLAKYSHVIIDVKGNLHFVKETKKGWLKRKFCSFYFEKIRLTSSTPKKSPTRAMARKIVRRLPNPLRHILPHRR